jgi:hypothetical protein
MERMPARAQSPRVIFALGVSVAAPLISRLPTGIKHRATTSRCKSTNNRIPFTPARPKPSYEGAVGSHANLFLCRRRSHTLTRHHQAFTRKTWWLRGQALASVLAAIQTVIANHYTSGVACGVYDRNRRRSIDSARPHPWHSRPGMNDLGTWAEL